MTTPRTMTEVDALLTAACVIRAKALINIELHLGAVSDLRTVYANEGTRMDALLDEKSGLCPDTLAVLVPKLSPCPLLEPETHG